MNTALYNLSINNTLLSLSQSQSQSCINWCIEQHIAKNFHNELIILAVIIMLAAWWIIDYITSKADILNLNLNLVHRLHGINRGLLYGVTFLIAAYAYLIILAIQ